PEAQRKKGETASEPFVFGDEAGKHADRVVAGGLPHRYGFFVAAVVDAVLIGVPLVGLDEVAERIRRETEEEMERRRLGLLDVEARARERLTRKNHLLHLFTES